MIKFFLGIVIGTFLTYNYIIPNESYKKALDELNLTLLNFLQLATTELENNVNNQRN